MASEKDDVFDPFDKMFPAEEECTTPGARRTAFGRDPHGTIGQALTPQTLLMISAQAF